MINSLPMAMTLPSTAGSLESYIQVVNRFPLLTEEEELRLAHQYRDHEDVSAAHGLVLSHLRLVVSIARGYLGYGLPHSDLIQEGNVGLMKAVKRYDPNRGVRLVSFAVHWIRAEIHEHILRNWRVVKVATTKAQRKLFFNLRSMKKGHGAMTQEETEAMASALRVKTSDVAEMEMRLGGQDISLEPIGDDDEDSFGPISYLSNPDEEPGRILEHEQNERLRTQGLASALNSLDPRSRRIIEARWLREEDTATLHELADEFKVSAERIRQIEAQAMKKMRTLIPAASA
jgi:RNA polymerase sigma-32 factor